MRHVYECQMRWSDMDMLGHVNNVTYVDYVREARIDLLARLGLPAWPREDQELRVLGHAVQFRLPVVYRGGSVRVECWAVEITDDAVTLAFEVFADGSGGVAAAFTATTGLAPYAGGRRRTWTPQERALLEEYRGAGPDVDHDSLPAVPAGGPRHRLALSLRHTDLDSLRRVDDVRFLEVFQEARIRYLSTLPREEDGPWSGWVVAAIDLECVRPVEFRREPYEVLSWVERVGNTSSVVCSELRDGPDGVALARCRVVMVGFDAEAQRAAAMNSHQRERLLAEHRAAHGNEAVRQG